MADDIPSIASAVVLPEPSELPPTPASPLNGFKRRQSSFSEQDGKRRRISTDEDARTRRESIPSTPAPGRAPELRKSNVDAVERKRGQRLFGAMLGALSQGSSSTSQRRRADIEKKQQAKLKLQEKEFDQKKQDRLDRLVAMRKKEQKRFDEESMRIRHSNLLNMAHFLCTKAEPRLYYKPWELTPAEEDQINAQVDEAQATIDQELDDFERRQEGEERFVRPDRVDEDIKQDAPETVRPVGSVPSGDEDPSSTTNGNTDHSVAIPVDDDAKDDDREKAKEEVVVNGEETTEETTKESDQQINPNRGAPDDTSKEAIDDTGDIVLEATEDTVIY